MRTALMRGGAILVLVFLALPARGASAPEGPTGDATLRQRIGELQVELEIVAAERQADPGDPRTGEAVRQAAASVRGRFAAVKRLVEAAQPRFGVIAELKALEDRLRRVNLAAPRALRTYLRSSPGPVDPAATGAISGTVTDNASVPLSGIYVEVYDPYGFQMAYTITNASGAYVTPAVLETGSYYVVAFGLGYVPEVYDNVPCSGCVLIDVGTPVQVTDGATTSGINFALGVGGTLTGTVTDAGTGAPLAEAWVAVYNSAGNFVDGHTTSASGGYSMDGLATGTYYAKTHASGHLPELYDDIPCTTWGTCPALGGTPIGITAGATTTGVDFSLSLGGRISGTVTSSASAAPLADVHVQIFDTAGFVAGSAYTDASGLYTCDSGGGQAGLTGSYYARTSNNQGYIEELYNNVACPGQACGLVGAGPISVTPGATTTGIDFALEPGGRISGTITSSATGAPLANVRVDIYTSTGKYVTGGNTNTSGVYVSRDGLPTGTYYARTWNEQGYVDELHNDIACPLQSCGVTGGALINVTAPLTSVINFALDPGGHVSGAVRDPTGQPLQVAILIYSSGGTLLGYGHTNGSGTYTTSTGLPTGTYYARSSNSVGYIDELYDNIPCPCAATEGTPIAVTAGATTTGINFVLGRGGRVSGTVADSATGAPLAVWVGIYSSAGALVDSGGTDASGLYTSRAGLPTGTYYAHTWNSQGYVDELYNDIACPAGSCSVTSGTPISVTSPLTTAGIDFALTQGGRISGTATDGSSGLPIAGVSVRIYNSSGTHLTTANSYGVYATWMGLPTGTYYAATFNSLGYVDELFDNIPCPGGFCKVTSGTPVAVTLGATTGGIGFELLLDLVFRNGFE